MNVSVHTHACYSEVLAILCLNKANELDDKIVWTAMLKPETEGEKSEICHVHQSVRIRRGREGKGENNNKDKLWQGKVQARYEGEKNLSSRSLTEVRHIAGGPLRLLPGRHTLVIGG